MSLEEEAVPEELEEQCVECHHALGSVERLLNPILGTNHAAIEEKVCTCMVHHKISYIYNYNLRYLKLVQ